MSESAALRFPELALKDLTGAALRSPTAFAAPWNLVLVAFRRRHQELIDPWIAWCLSDEVAGRLVPWELPALSRIWAPFRPVIDGGMATGVGELAAKRRTLTYYGPLRRLTSPLRIDDRSTISILLLDAAGLVVDRGLGAFDPELAQRLLERRR